STTTTLVSSANPSGYGQSVTFTATVSANAPGSGTPTGTVQFQVDGVNYGSPVSLVNAQASVSDSALAVGDHSITATYTGDGNFTGSNSNLQETVTPRTVYWTGAAGDGNWDTPGNWSTNAVPGPNDAVTIDNSVVQNPFIVTHSANIADSVYSL